MFSETAYKYFCTIERRRPTQKTTYGNAVVDTVFLREIYFFPKTYSKIKIEMG
jgi:hypothetical protein